MMRYIRAFFTALQMTMRGEKVPYQTLIEWIEQGQKLSKHVFSVAEANGMDEQARKQITLKIDGREQSLQTIIAGVQYHVQQEYPYLLQNLTEHSITAIYASNMNDQYAMQRLSEHEGLQQKAATHAAIQQLNDHLKSIPPSNSLTD